MSGTHGSTFLTSSLLKITHVLVTKNRFKWAQGALGETSLIKIPNCWSWLMIMDSHVKMVKWLMGQCFMLSWNMHGPIQRDSCHFYLYPHVTWLLFASNFSAITCSEKRNLMTFQLHCVNVLTLAFYPALSRPKSFSDILHIYSS